MSTLIPIASCSSSGISVISGPPHFERLDAFQDVQSKHCRTVLFSPDGDYLAYLKDTQCVLVNTNDWSNDVVIEPCNAYDITFSPKATYLSTWEPLNVSDSNPNGSPNLHIYESKTGKLIKNFEQRKQTDWRPQWSSDEKIFSILINNVIIFCKDSNFDKVVTRLESYKVKSYSLSPIIGLYFFMCHTLGSPGEPAHGRLFRYPHFKTEDTLVSKCFFQDDKVECLWNSKGFNAIFLSSREVNKTGASYYGKKSIHLFNLRRHFTMIHLGEEYPSPIYSVEWSPNNIEFCVIYGFRPSKATIFNVHGQVVFVLGHGLFNSIYYNPQGNILLLGIVGNLSGDIVMWNTVNWKQISSFHAQDTTFLEWAPDGTHFLTATTSPRLRVNNGYKIWHSSGSLLYEKASVNEELISVTWKNYPKDTFKNPLTTITAQKSGGDSTQSNAALKQMKNGETEKAIEQDGYNEIDSTAVKQDANGKLKEQQVQGVPVEVNQLSEAQEESDLFEELEPLL